MWDFDNKDLGKNESGCPTKGCPVSDKKWPKPDPNCTCGKPLMIVIPAGEHIHPCKVHPEKVIFGQEVCC